MTPRRPRGPALDTAHTGSFCPSLRKTRELGSNPAQAGVPAADPAAPSGGFLPGGCATPPSRASGRGEAGCGPTTVPTEVGLGLPQSQERWVLVLSVQRTLQRRVSCYTAADSQRIRKKNISEKWPYRQISVTSARADVCAWNRVGPLSRRAGRGLWGQQASGRPGALAQSRASAWRAAGPLCRRIPCEAAGPWCHTLGGGELARMATLPTSGGLHAPCCLGFQAWALTGQGGQRRRVASTHTRAPGAVAPELPPRAGPAASTPASAVTPASLLFAGSPKPSPTGRSPPPRRRRCTWSQSTPSPESRTSGSRSWWCCPGRSTSTSGWPATVRGGGGGAGQDGLSFPRGPPELVLSICMHKLIEAEARDDQPRRALGSLQRQVLGAGPGRTGGGTPGQGEAAGHKRGSRARMGRAVAWGRLTCTCQPGLALSSRSTPAGPCAGSPQRSGCLCGRELVLPAMLVVSPTGWGWQELGCEVFCPGLRGGHLVSVARGTLPSSAPWPVLPALEGSAVLRLWSLVWSTPAATPRA